MPTYDMICTGCAFLAKDQYYKSFELFEKADKTCPCCNNNELQRAEVQMFNAGRKTNQTYTTDSGHRLKEKQHTSTFQWLSGPYTGEKFRATLVERVLDKDPRLN